MINYCCYSLQNITLNQSIISNMTYIIYDIYIIYVTLNQSIISLLFYVECFYTFCVGTVTSLFMQVKIFVVPCSLHEFLFPSGETNCTFSRPSWLNKRVTNIQFCWLIFVAHLQLVFLTGKLRTVYPIKLIFKIKIFYDNRKLNTWKSTTFLL